MEGGLRPPFFVGCKGDGEGANLRDATLSEDAAARLRQRRDWIELQVLDQLQRAPFNSVEQEVNTLNPFNSQIKFQLRNVWNGFCGQEHADMYCCRLQF